MPTTVTVTERIHAPIERVFAVFSDLHGASENIDGIEQLEVLTDGPIGAGHAFPRDPCVL